MIAVVAVLGLMPSLAAAKKNHGEGVTACQARIAERIQADHPPSRGSSFDKHVERETLGDNALTIRGAGTVHTAKGKNRSFAYSCVYNHRSGKLSKVKYSIR
jgi:hypothetical protein